MNLNISFQVSFNCDHYKIAEQKELIEKDVKIILDLDKETASNFIFRSGSSNFTIGNYRIILKFATYVNFILITDNSDTYIVTNIDEVLSNITEGYTRILTLDKISNLLEFDFLTSLKDDSGIVNV